MLKKILSLLVCGMMAVAMTPALAMADEGSVQREVSTLAELKAALNETNVEIKVNSDIQVDDTLTVAEGKTVTLDLNGHKLVCQKGAPKGKYAIDNKGTLTIEDKSTEANGTVASRGVSNSGTLTMKNGILEAIDDGGGAGVWNEGDFVMTGGELKVSGDPIDKIAATPLVSAKADTGSKVPTVKVSGGKFSSKYTNINILGGKAEISDVNLSTSETFWMAFKAGTGSDVTLNKVKINAVKGGCLDASGGKVELNDCEFIQTEKVDWNSTALASSNGGVLTVNSGVYKGDAAGGYGAYIFNSGGKIKINGGEITAKTALKLDKSTTSAKSEIEVTGGKFDGSIDVAEGSTLTVKGGTFKNAGNTLDTYLAEGMAALNTEDGSIVMSSEHKKIVDDLKAKLEETNGKLEAANKEIKKLKEELEKEKTASIDLKAKLAEAEENLKKANAEVESLKKQLETEKAATETVKVKLAEAEENLKKANDEVTALKAEVEQQKTALAEKEQKLSETEQKVKELQERIDAEKAKAEEITAKLKEAKEELDEVKNALETQKESAAKLQAELEKAKEDVAEVNKKLADAEAKLKESDLFTATVKKEAAELRTKLEAAEKKVSELEKQLKEKTAKSTEIEKQLEAAKKEAQTLKEQLTTVNKNVQVKAPAKVAGLKAKVKKGTVKLSWKKVSGANGYVVYKAARKNGKFKQLKTINSAETVSITDNKVKKSKMYFYKVKAYANGTDGKLFGEFSKVKKTKAK